MLLSCNRCLVSEVPNAHETLPGFHRQLSTVLLLCFCSCYSSYLEHSSLPTPRSNTPSKPSTSASSCISPNSLLQQWEYTCQRPALTWMELTSRPWLHSGFHYYTWEETTLLVSCSRHMTKCDTKAGLSWEALDNSDAGFGWRTQRPGQSSLGQHTHPQLSIPLPCIQGQARMQAGWLSQVSSASSPLSHSCYLPIDFCTFSPDLESAA